MDTKQYQKLLALRKTTATVLEALDEMIKANAPTTSATPKKRISFKEKMMEQLDQPGWRKMKP